MQSHDNFADRLRHIEQRKSAPVSHVMVADYIERKGRLNVQRNKRKRSFVGLNICMILILVTLGFRAATMTAGIDLEQRRAELADGTEQERIAGYIVQATMIADPILLSIFNLKKSARA